MKLEYQVMMRDEAYQLLTKYLHNKNLIKHCLAAEASMKGLYRHLHKEDLDQAGEEKWGIVGLLHDIDYEVAQSRSQLDKHARLLFDNGEVRLPEEIEYSIRSHNFEGTGTMPKSDMDWAIASVDQLTGLIVAAALVHPDRKLKSLTVEYVLNRFKEKSFARGADRRFILLCEEKLKIPLKTFIEMTLKAMQEISDQLGL